MNRSLVLLTFAILIYFISGCANAMRNGNEDNGLIVTRKTYESGHTVETTIDHTWNTESKGVAEKTYSKAWEHHSNLNGQDIVVRLFRRDFMVGTFDGGAYFIIAFQLPGNLKTGQEFTLKPIPVDRLTLKDVGDKKMAYMKNGEITSFKFGNPMMGWMPSTLPVEANTKILSMNDRLVTIHLRLKAKLQPSFEFDIDEEFSVRVIHNNPDNNASHGSR